MRPKKEFYFFLKFHPTEGPTSWSIDRAIDQTTQGILKISDKNHKTNCFLVIVFATNSKQQHYHLPYPYQSLFPYHKTTPDQYPTPTPIPCTTLNPNLTLGPKSNPTRFPWVKITFSQKHKTNSSISIAPIIFSSSMNAPSYVPFENYKSETKEHFHSCFPFFFSKERNSPQRWQRAHIETTSYRVVDRIFSFSCVCFWIGYSWLCLVDSLLRYFWPCCAWLVYSWLCSPIL